MIAALRRRHRLAWGALALLAPVLLVGALLLRVARPSDVSPRLPAALLARLGDAPGVSDAAKTARAPDSPGAATRFADLPLLVRVLADDGASGRSGDSRTLELQPEEPLLEPDVLVYVLARTTNAATAAPGTPAAAAPGAPSVDAPGAALPADARLLGALSGTLRRRWPLPADADELLLYTLGHQFVLARGALPATEAMGAPAPMPAPTPAPAPAGGGAR